MAIKRLLAVMVAALTMGGCLPIMRMKQQPRVAHTAVVFREQHLTITLQAKDFPQLNMKQLAMVVVGTDDVADGWMVDGDGKQVTVEYRCKGREQEEGRIRLLLKDSRGAQAEVMVALPDKRRN